MLEQIYHGFPLYSGVSTQEAPPATGIVGRTSNLLGAVGSGLWSGATGAVSLGFGALQTGVSAGTSVVSGVVSMVPFPGRSQASAEPATQPESAEGNTDAPKPPEPKQKPGLIARTIFRKTSSKDKAE